jgi:predicted RNA-binding Zn ribbon-like protein
VGDEGVSDETLTTYEELLDWLEEAGALPPTRNRALRSAARAEGAADRALRHAHHLRQTIHGLFVSIAAGSPDTNQVAKFNEFLSALPLRLERAGEAAYAWQWWSDDPDPSDVVRPVVWAAASLLRSPEVTFVKTCGNERCGWLFVDRSRRRNRRWCDMRDCGNRAKARRYYERHRRRSKS